MIVPYHPLRIMQELMECYQQPIRTVPTMPADPAERLLRARLVFEEAVEFVDAMGCYIEDEPDGAGLKVQLGTLPADLIEAADALGDIKVVVYGSDLSLGLPAYDILAEIHRSNMSKMGPDGKPIKNEYGKVTKGPNYTRPDIASVLRAHGWQEEEVTI